MKFLSLFLFSHFSLFPSLHISRQNFCREERWEENFSIFSMFLSLPLALSLATEIFLRGGAGGKASLSSPLPLFHNLCSSLSLSLLHLLLFYPSFTTEDLTLFHLFHLLLVSRRKLVTRSFLFLLYAIFCHQERERREERIECRRERRERRESERI